MPTERTQKTDGSGAAARLAELEARERTLLDRIDDAYYEVDLSGTFTLVNRAFADLLGLAVEDIVDSSFADYVDSDQYHTIRQLFGDVYETGNAVEAAEWQFNGVRGDGLRTVEGSIELLRDAESGKPRGFSGIVRDVTAADDLQRALTERDARLTMLFEESHEAVFVFDAERTILDHNVAAEKLTRRPRSELVGTHYLDLYAPEDLAQNPPDIASVEAGHAISRERLLVRPDGSRVPIHVDVSRLSDGTRMARVRDITAERETQGELQRGREVMERAQAIAHFGSWDWDIIEGSLNWSDEIYRIFGLQPQDFGATYDAFLEYIHADDREAVEKAVNLAVAGEQDYNIEHRVVRPDGSERVAHETGEVSFDSDGTALRMIGVVQDVTDLRAAEHAIRERDSRLALLFQEAADAVLVTVPAEKGKVLDFNDAALELLGRTAEEFAGMTYIDLLAPDELRIRPSKVDMLRSGEVVGAERNFLRPDGSMRPVNVRAKQLSNDTAVIVLRDLTEQRAAEFAVRERDDRLLMLLEESDDAIFLMRDGKGILEFNKRTVSLLGYEPDELYGLQYADHLHPDSQADFKETINRVAAGETTSSIRRLFRKDGELITVEARAKLLPDGGTLVSLRDVTEQQQAEEALKERERLIASVVSSASLMLAALDGEGNYTVLSGSQSPTIDATGRHYTEIAGPDFTKAADRLYATGEPQSWTESFRGQTLQITLIPDLEGQTVTGAVAVGIDVTERQAAERLNTRLGQIVEDSANEVYVFGEHDLRFIQVNRGARENLGYTEDELSRMTPLSLKPEFTQAQFEAQIAPLHDGTEELISFETLHLRKNGTTYPVEVQLSLSRAESPPVFIAIIQDISERTAAERQLRQSQKLEAVGRLAGGIAHDFNNLLTVVNGYSGMALEQLNTSHEIYGDLKAIHDAGIRGASLVSQLLEFTSQQMVSPELVDLNELLLGLSGMLRPLIGDDVKLETVTANEAVRITVDANQIEQVLMNLAVNARDAMPNGGRLTFTAEAGTDAEGAPVALLHVDDTGAGMPPEVAERIFEPFYTTKEPGKGTGLGLASAHGIIAQAGGEISVESELDRGTRFTITLPLDPRNKNLTEDATTVLVVEDEADVRQFTSDVLRRASYQVIEAANRGEAVSLYKHHSVSVSLVLTDVVMPGGSGFETVRQLRRLNAALPVIYMSAHVERTVPDQLLLAEDGYLQKPFTPAKLVEVIREVIGTRVADDTGPPGG